MQLAARRFVKTSGVQGLSVAGVKEQGVGRPNPGREKKRKEREKQTSDEQIPSPKVLAGINIIAFGETIQSRRDGLGGGWRYQQGPAGGQDELAMTMSVVAVSVSFVTVAISEVSFTISRF